MRPGFLKLGIRAMGQRSHPAFKVIVNGMMTETTAETLQALLDEQGYGEERVATARNGAFVPRRVRDETSLKPGDSIEVVSARQGG